MEKNCYECKYKFKGIVYPYEDLDKIKTKSPCKECTNYSKYKKGIAIQTKSEKLKEKKYSRPGVIK